MTGRSGGTNMYCPVCKKITRCSSERFLLSNQSSRNWESKQYKDIHWFERGRLCEECFKGFDTVEFNRKFLIELFDLRDLVLELVGKLKQNASGHKIEKYNEVFSRIISNRTSNNGYPPGTSDTNDKDPRKIAMVRFMEINQMPYGERGGAMNELSGRLGVSCRTLAGWKTQYKKTEKIEDRRKTTGPRKKVHTDYIKIWKEIDALYKKGYSPKQIVQKLGVSESQVRRVKSRYKGKWF